MAIIGYATLLGLGLAWALMRSPLGRAIGTSFEQFAAASQGDRGDLT